MMLTEINFISTKKKESWKNMNVMSFRSHSQLYRDPSVTYVDFIYLFLTIRTLKTVFALEPEIIHVYVELKEQRNVKSSVLCALYWQ